MLFFLIGGGVNTILVAAYKVLRWPSMYWTTLVMTLSLGFYGTILMNEPFLAQMSGNPGIFLLLPCLFTLCYGLTRLTFIQVFHEEPILTSFEQLNKRYYQVRDPHWGDILFTVTNLVLPLLVTLLLGRIL